MKKLVLVLGLVIGSMVASDAIAAVYSNATAIENNDISKNDRKKKKKKHCKSDASSTKTKGCSKEGASCCKKKTTTDAPAPSK